MLHLWRSGIYLKQLLCPLWSSHALWHVWLTCIPVKCFVQASVCPFVICGCWHGFHSTDVKQYSLAVQWHFNTASLLQCHKKEKTQCHSESFWGFHQHTLNLPCGHSLPVPDSWHPEDRDHVCGFLLHCCIQVWLNTHDGISLGTDDSCIFFCCF